MPILDRRVGKEPANRGFPVRAVAGQVPTRAVWWTPGAVLDQGATGHCVAFACTGEASDSPVRFRPVDAGFAHQWYYEIKRKGYDPFGLEDGSTVNAGMRVGRDRGLWEGWRWAFSLDDVKRALTVGPVVAGTVWRSGMWEPDRHGFIHPTGVDEGGHAYRITGWSPNFHRRGPAFRLHNSWGRSWGVGGRAYISEQDLWALLREDGEAAVPVGRSLGPGGSM